MSKLNETILDTLENQSDVFTLDEMANNIEAALIDVSGGPDHYIGITYPDWTFQHPLTERFEGSLMNCHFTQLGGDIAHAIYNSEGEGRFRVWKDESSVIMWERAEESSEE